MPPPVPVKSTSHGFPNWDVVRQEWAVLAQQCRDGQPGLTEVELDDLARESGVLDQWYRQHYQTFIDQYQVCNEDGTHCQPLRLQRFAARFERIGTRNLRAILLEVLNPSPRGFLLLNVRPFGASRGGTPCLIEGVCRDPDEPMYAGAYKVIATNELGDAGRQRLREHIAQEFTARGIPLTSAAIEVSAPEAIQTTIYSPRGTTADGARILVQAYTYTIRFLPPACPK